MASLFREQIARELGELAHQLRLHGELAAGYGLAASPASLNLAPLPARRFPPDPSARPASAPSSAPSSPASSPASTSRVIAPSAEPVRAGQGLLLEAGASAPAGKRPPRAESGEELEARRGRNREELRGLYRELDGCVLCRLHESRTRLVFGQGDAAAELVFVGEGPGSNEDRQGLAFVGPSGELLTRMIEAMGLDREDAFICNVVKCRPPKNRNPEPDEMRTCVPFLERQLSIIQPRVIVALGRTAGVGLGLLGVNESLGRNRGFHRWNGIPTMLTYHPAYLLRSPRDKRLTWHDLQQVLPYLTRRRSVGGGA